MDAVCGTHLTDARLSVKVLVRIYGFSADIPCFTQFTNPRRLQDRLGCLTGCLSTQNQLGFAAKMLNATRFWVKSAPFHPNNSYVQLLSPLSGCVAG